MKYIAQNIRMIREEVLGATRKEFSVWSGISEYKLANYEDGRTVPKLYVVHEIAKKVEISPEDLMNKKLTKTDIPMIIIKQVAVDSPDNQAILKELEDKKSEIESLKKEKEKLLRIIENLTANA